jgi:hypothetical protein
MIGDSLGRSVGVGVGVGVTAPPGMLGRGPAGEASGVERASAHAARTVAQASTSATTERRCRGVRAARSMSFSLLRRATARHREGRTGLSTPDHDEVTDR